MSLLHFHSFQWIGTAECAPPHRVSHPEKLEELIELFRSSGWDRKKPALVGYRNPDDSYVLQLLSGSHRWAAAATAGLEQIPVCVVPSYQVHAWYGDLWRWSRMMDVPTVEELERGSRGRREQQAGDGVRRVP